MKIFTIVFERLPMVWFLLGLLFNALALYLGFEHPMFFIYMILGWACCIYGLALYFLQLRESRKKPEKTRLSRNFISVGDSGSMSTPTPAPAETPSEQPEQ